jgi:3-dehydroquinate synthetase
LPTAIPADWSDAALLDAMRRDKKNRAGRLRFVLLQGGLGQASVVDGVDESVVRAVLRACTA